jgi:hypothetical protein
MCLLSLACFAKELEALASCGIKAIGWFFLSVGGSHGVKKIKECIYREEKERGY